MLKNVYVQSVLFTTNEVYCCRRIKDMIAVHVHIKSSKPPIWKLRLATCGVPSKDNFLLWSWKNLPLHIHFGHCLRGCKFLVSYRRLTKLSQFLCVSISKHHPHCLCCCDYSVACFITFKWSRSQNILDADFTPPKHHSEHVIVLFILPLDMYLCWMQLVQSGYCWDYVFYNHLSTSTMPASDTYLNYSLGFCHILIITLCQIMSSDIKQISTLMCALYLIKYF